MFEVVVLLLLVEEAPFTTGVAPGSAAPGIEEDKVASAPVIGEEGRSGDKGTSVSLGKLSVYNTLAGFLQLKPTDVIQFS